MGFLCYFLSTKPASSPQGSFLDGINIFEKFSLKLVSQMIRKWLHYLNLILNWELLMELILIWLDFIKLSAMQTISPLLDPILPCVYSQSICFCSYNDQLHILQYLRHTLRSVIFPFSSLTLIAYLYFNWVEEINDRPLHYQILHSSWQGSNHR